MLPNNLNQGKALKGFNPLSFKEFDLVTAYYDQLLIRICRNFNSNQKIC